MIEPIIIGNVRFRYRTKKHFRDASDGTRLMGQISYGKSTITTDRDLSAEMLRVVLLHEIQHGIREQAGLPSEEHTERDIDIMAYGLLGVLRRNKPLIAFMQQEEQ
jgi:hypothetical protein